MAMSGYTSIKKDAKAFDEALNQKCTTVSGELASPFQEFAKFTLTDDPIDVLRREDGKVFTIIWLKGEDGKDVEMWLSMLLKTDVENHQKVVSESTINKKFAEAIAGKDLTNKEFAQAFIDIVGKKTIQVTRTRYIRSVPTKRGMVNFPASLVGFEFVD